jgi:c-di-GMP-related signal transduction protein
MGLAVATLSIFAGAEEKPRELIETALVRAPFCELVPRRRHAWATDSADQLLGATTTAVVA